MPDEYITKSTNKGPPADDFAGERSPAVFEMAWLQLRLGWPTVAKIRLDQEKKDALTTLVRHYQLTRQPDRPSAEFEQVHLRLQEEHALRLRELVKEERKAAKQQNNLIKVIQDTNASKVQSRKDRIEETPPIIAEWKCLMNMLFGGTTSASETPATHLS